MAASIDGVFDSFSASTAIVAVMRMITRRRCSTWAPTSPSSLKLRKQSGSAAGRHTLSVRTDISLFTLLAALLAGEARLITGNYDLASYGPYTLRTHSGSAPSSSLRTLTDALRRITMTDDIILVDILPCHV